VRYISSCRWYLSEPVLANQKLASFLQRTCLFQTSGARPNSLPLSRVQHVYGYTNTVLGAKITARGNPSRLPSLAKGIINSDSCITTECADPNRLTAQTLVIFQQTVGMSTSFCKKKPLMKKGIDHDTAPKLLHALHGPPPEAAAFFEASSLSLLSFST
jgi:hypothetical protein